MKKAILLVCLLSLGACASMDEITTAGPKEIIQSANSPVVLAECVVKPAPSHFSTSMIAAGGFRITRINTGVFTDFIEIRPKGEGSEIHSYARSGTRTFVSKCV